MKGIKFVNTRKINKYFNSFLSRIIMRFFGEKREILPTHFWRKTPSLAVKWIPEIMDKTVIKETNISIKLIEFLGL